MSQRERTGRERVAVAWLLRMVNQSGGNLFWGGTDSGTGYLPARLKQPQFAMMSTGHGALVVSEALK